jgi:hypothetical protein
MGNGIEELKSKEGSLEYWQTRLDLWLGRLNFAETCGNEYQIRICQIAVRTCRNQIIIVQTRGKWVKEYEETANS